MEYSVVTFYNLQVGTREVCSMPRDYVITLFKHLAANGFLGTFTWRSNERYRALDLSKFDYAQEAEVCQLDTTNKE